MALMIWRRPAEADDFAPFYRAALISGTHGDVYGNPSGSPRDPADNRFLPYVRLPQYAAALRPLIAFSYLWARRLWITILTMSALGCVWLVPAARRGVFAMAMAWSFPLTDALMVGQDISLVLFVALAVARTLEAGRDFTAGLLASLLAIKPTFLPAMGIVFLARSRGGFLGFLTGVTAQAVISFAMAGFGWPGTYFSVLRNPLLDPDPVRMLNLRAIASGLSLPVAVWAASALALYVGLWFLCRRAAAWDGVAAALAVGLIASPHSRIYDGVVFIPLFLGAGRAGIVGLTPVLYLMVLMAPAHWATAGGTLLVTLAMVAGVRLFRAKTTAVLSS